MGMSIGLTSLVVDQFSGVIRVVGYVYRCYLQKMCKCLFLFLIFGH